MSFFRVFDSALGTWKRLLDSPTKNQMQEEVAVRRVMLRGESVTKTVTDELKQLIYRNPKLLTISEMAILDRAIVEHSFEIDLPSLLQVWMSRCASICSLQSAVGNEEDIALENDKSRILACIDCYYDDRLKVVAFEKGVKGYQIAAGIIVALLLTVILFTIDSILTGRCSVRYIPSIYYAIIPGLLGGLISILAPSDAVKVTNDSNTEIPSKYSLFIAPVRGACFAIVLFFLFCSGAVQGELFPKIITAPGDDLNRETSSQTAQQPEQSPILLSESKSASSPSDLSELQGTKKSLPQHNPKTVGTGTEPAQKTMDSKMQEREDSLLARTRHEQITESRAIDQAADRTRQFIRGTHPNTGQDYCKLILWAFIAGYIYKFVPSLLSKSLEKVK